MIYTATATAERITKWYTTGQVARWTGYSRRQVLRMCVSGLIPSQRFGNEYRIPGDWLDSYLAKQRNGVVRRKPR